MSKISFEDIGSVVATFLADSGVKGRQVVKADGQRPGGPLFRRRCLLRRGPGAQGPVWPQCR